MDTLPFLVSVKTEITQVSTYLQEGVAQPGELVLIRQSSTTDHVDFLTICWNDGWKFSHNIFSATEHAMIAAADINGEIDGQTVLPIVISALARWDCEPS